jgi:disulfide bond formation protein DsbB
MIKTLSSRQWLGFIALAATASMLFAFYLQYVVELVVCPLCLTQRVFVVGTGLTALLAFIHNPNTLGIRIYALIGAVFAFTGAGFAGRHVWLQHLPEDQVPACGPSLQYMLETLPFTDALTTLLMGDGNCAERVWELFGLSIPELTLLLFVGFGGILLWQTLSPKVGRG